MRAGRPRFTMGTVPCMHTTTHSSSTQSALVAISSRMVQTGNTNCLRRWMRQQPGCQQVVARSFFLEMRCRSHQKHTFGAASLNSEVPVASQRAVHLATLAKWDAPALRAENEPTYGLVASRSLSFVESDCVEGNSGNNKSNDPSSSDLERCCCGETDGALRDAIVHECHGLDR